MATIQEIEQEIISEFEVLGGDPEMNNIYLIELGQKLAPLPESDKVEKNIVKGCQSKVWLTSQMDDGRIYYQADSNTVITKGLVSLLIRVLSGQSPDAIQQAELNFVNQIGLDRFIGTQRSNGFAAMIKQMKLDAMAHAASLKEG